LTTTEIPPASLDELMDRVGNLSDAHRSTRRPRGDLRSGEVYVVTTEIVTAVKVALVTGRPLLLGGPPGCGKSSLASYVARNLGVHYHEFVADDESRASDLLWRYDPIRRLNDAQTERLGQGAASVARYIEPGPLWWALHPSSAARRGLDEEAFRASDNVEPARPGQLLEGYEPARPGSVLLIDEIDKADAAFSNGLLVPLGSKQFVVTDLGRTVMADPALGEWNPLVIITTNNERDLPEAFLRRCIVLQLPAPTKEVLVEVVRRHFSADGLTDEDTAIVRDLAEQVSAGTAESEQPVSTAEFIDLVNVALAMRSEYADPDKWEIVTQMVVRKNVAFGRRSRRWA
jgi:MoxR-like ATPase